MPDNRESDLSKLLPSGKAKKTETTKTGTPKKRKSITSAKREVMASEGIHPLTKADVKRLYRAKQWFISGHKPGKDLEIVRTLHSIYKSYEMYALRQELQEAKTEWLRLFSMGKNLVLSQDGISLAETLLGPELIEALNIKVVTAGKEISSRARDSFVEDKTTNEFTGDLRGMPASSLVGFDSNDSTRTKLIVSMLDENTVSLYNGTSITKLPVEEAVGRIIVLDTKQGSEEEFDTIEVPAKLAGFTNELLFRVATKDNKSAMFNNYADLARYISRVGVSNVTQILSTRGSTNSFLIYDKEKEKKEFGGIPQGHYLFSGPTPQLEEVDEYVSDLQYPEDLIHRRRFAAKQKFSSVLPYKKIDDVKEFNGPFMFDPETGLLTSIPHTHFGQVLDPTTQRPLPPEVGSEFHVDIDRTTATAQVPHEVTEEERFARYLTVNKRVRLTQIGDPIVSGQSYDGEVGVIVRSKLYYMHPITFKLVSAVEETGSRPVFKFSGLYKVVKILGVLTPKYGSKIVWVRSIEVDKILDKDDVEENRAIDKMLHNRNVKLVGKLLD